ncbi:MAG TPA: DegT/DnrJ/EryC1/StrS family aminotransferase [Pseudobdellovibrionaceae bacterium]|jgi:dTDP-4-amino-4,6-dideoxygalactose transaminase
MSQGAPNPRYRIYSKLWYYTRFFSDLMFGKFHKGNDVELLEDKLKSRFGVRNAVCTPMARVGIYLAVKNLIKPGQKVIMSPYTIADVVNMVIAAKGVPLFADIERATCNIRADEVARLITQPNVGAVLITHLHGLAASVAEIQQICEKHNIPMLEDCAQAFGTVVGGRPVGCFGKAGIYSLGMYKNINSWYGGFVITNDDSLAQVLRKEISSWPYQNTFFIFKRMFKSLKADVLTIPILFKSFTFWIFKHGFINDIEFINKFVRTELDTRRHDEFPERYKGKLTPYQARLALSQLDLINPDTEIRIKYADKYRLALSGYSDLILPPTVDKFVHMYTYFPIQYKERDTLIKWMMKFDRDLAAQHLKNCADLESFKEFYRDCPNARATAEQVILLPTYPRYGYEDVEKNIEVLKAFFKPVTAAQKEYSNVVRNRTEAERLL